MTRKVIGFITYSNMDTEFNFGPLEKASGMKFKRAIRELFTNTTNMYLLREENFKQAPTVPQVRKRIMEIYEATEKLLSLLGDDTPLEKTVKGAGLREETADGDEFGDSIPLVDILEKLRDYKLTAWHRLDEDKAGRPPKDEQHLFVREVGKIYDKAGGKSKGDCHWDSEKGKYVGPLFRLVCELLTQAKEAGGPDFEPSTVGGWLKARGEKWEPSGIDKNFVQDDYFQVAGGCVGPRKKTRYATFWDTKKKH